MTICLCHGGICELSIRCSWPPLEVQMCVWGGGVATKKDTFNSPSTSCSEHGSTETQTPHRRLTPHTTGTGIGAPRPHAVNGVFPRALCFWVVVTLGTILGFVHCDALFVLTRQVPYVFGAGTRRLYVMLSGLAAAACSQCAPASRKRHVGCSCTYQAVS